MNTPLPTEGAPAHLQRCLPCVFGSHECLGVWNVLAPASNRLPCLCPVCHQPKVPIILLVADSSMDTRKAQ